MGDYLFQDYRLALYLIAIYAAVFLIPFVILLFLFTKLNKKSKIYIHGIWKRVLIAFIISLILFPVLLYVFVIVSELVSGRAHF